MNFGLYQLKFLARKSIAWMLPRVKDVDPNTVSWLMLPVGISVAVCCYLGLHGLQILLLVGIFLSLLRLFLGTLDGLMAVHFKKESPKGEIINRLAPELCDLMYLIAICLADPSYFLLGLGAISVAWLTSFAGLVGTIAGKPIQSGGPVGQTDRVAALMLALLIQYFAPLVNVFGFFLCWCVVGGLITIVLRLQKSLKKDS